MASGQNFFIRKEFSLFAVDHTANASVEMPIALAKMVNA